MAGNLLILIGALLIVTMFAGGYHLASLNCAPESLFSCDKGALKIVSELMIANEGLLLWAAWVAGVFLIWGGVRLRARRKRSS